MRQISLAPLPLPLPLALFLGLAAAAPAEAQLTTTVSHQKISDLEGGFGGTIDDDDLFGTDVAAIGDLDGDGVGELAVGAKYDDDGYYAAGAVWILFLNANRTVKSAQKISATAGGFTGTLGTTVIFGESVAGLGDLNGNGVEDIAVGAPGDDDGGGDRGAVWILFLNANGTVASHHKVSQSSGELGGSLSNYSNFGSSVAAIGDLDGDGVVDLAAGGRQDPDGEGNNGAVWILFLRANGTVKGYQKISDTAGGFAGEIDQYDFFGTAVAGLGDRNGDGAEDLAVGAPGDDDGGSACGAVWILFLNASGTVQGYQKISNTSGGLGAVIAAYDQFGESCAAIGDLDGNGIGDLAIGAVTNDDGGADRGAAWILLLAAGGTVGDAQRISDTAGGFAGSLDDNDRFGCGVAGLGDLSGDGTTEIAVGAFYDDDGGFARGAVWVLSVASGPYAASVWRNPSVGGITNPSVYSYTSPPVVGGAYSAAIGTTGKAGCLLAGYAAPLTLAGPWGNFLVDFISAGGELLGLPAGLGDPAVITLPVPLDYNFLGVTLATQAVRFGGGIDLTNARDLTLGF
ncbi:MAG: integrin alpha [Planctomycetota bacterium]